MKRVLKIDYKTRVQIKKKYTEFVKNKLLMKVMYQS